MTEHPNVARIRDGDAAFAKGDLGALNDLFAEDMVWHDAGRNQTSVSTADGRRSTGSSPSSWSSPGVLPGRPSCRLRRRRARRRAGGHFGQPGRPERRGQRSARPPFPRPQGDRILERFHRPVRLRRGPRLTGRQRPWAVRARSVVAAPRCTPRTGPGHTRAGWPAGRVARPMTGLSAGPALRGCPRAWPG
jgi:hypothetical protein